MTDATTTSRVLRLLSLLQSRRAWQGSELAERVRVSPRTIRRDVDRLRELGYRIAAERGPIGGYRLEAGAELPPLLFTADEAVALALGLRAGAADGAVRDIADLTVSVLAKLEQVLPAAARAQVHATQGAISAPEPVRPRELVDPETFAALALACRDSEIVRFGYLAADHARSSRRVEPVALVPVAGRWYLLAWDLGPGDWRTFRLDRILRVTHTRLVVPRRDVPSADAGAFVLERLSLGSIPRYGATVRIAAPFSEVAALLGPFTTGLRPDGRIHTLWSIHDDRLEILAGALTWLVWPFTIADGDDLRAFVHGFAARLTA